jgi:hypothetical protein
LGECMIVISMVVAAAAVEVVTGDNRRTAIGG